SAALSPDGKFVAFNVETPEGPSRIQIYDMETKKRRTIVKYQSASQFAWLPDSSAIIYSTLSGYKRYSRYFDLWRYDLNTKKALRLTSGERARDPAVHPDGKRVLFVAGGPEGDELKVLDLETKSITSFGDSQEKGIQFFRPQWSPDGKRVVVSRHTPDEKWKLYLYTLRDRGGISARGLVLETSPRSLQSNGVHELDPIWFADNKSVFYSSDQSGISNLHRVNVKTGKTEQLTNVASGLFHPTTADGDTFIAQHYTAKGFELVRFQVTARGLYSTRRLGGGADLERSEKSGEGFPLPRLSSRSDTDLAQNEASIEHTPYKSSKYVAFGKSLFLPRYIAPNVFYTGETVLMSATTGAADPLRWHSWLGGASYRLDAKHLGYFGSYVYTRFRPTFGLGVNDFVVNYGNLTFDGDGDLTTANDRRTVHYFEERRGGYAYVSMPFSKHSVSASFFAEDHSPKPELTAAEEAALNTGIFSGVRVGYGYGDYEQYPASISREDGRRIQLFASMSDSVFGSGENNEQVILSGEWREYVNLWKRHVLALRAMGGTTLGDRVIQGTFSMGGALGEGAFAGGGSLFYLPLRGLPVASFSRTRAMLLSSEYRIPLTSPERGLGTTPFFLKNIHAGFFADYGNAWNAGEGGSDDVKTFFDDFFLGVGAELRGDFVVGYGLPITGRLGYGIIVLNRDRLGRLIDDVTGTSAKNGTVILQLGTSF
ncbi:MAG: PD40 domain-containing protein, partial [Deltaproteobacteria bacterium]|nr:PD40 domain-containing protein [Deltaproteobacteria bacterium]